MVHHCITYHSSTQTTTVQHEGIFPEVFQCFTKENLLLLAIIIVSFKSIIIKSKSILIMKRHALCQCCAFMMFLY